MAGTKTWNIGDVLTASDLNENFTKLPFASASFRFTRSSSLAANGSATFAVAFPTSRFSVAPNVTVSSSSNVLTAYIDSVSAGTVTVGLCNNGAATSGTGIVVTGIALQMTSGTASG